MSIEFRCTQCNKLLRTSDNTAGKQAKCPECGTVLMIPSPGAQAPAAPQAQAPQAPSPGPAPTPGPAAGSPFGAGAAPAAAPENSYQSPGDYGPGAAAMQGGGTITPTRIDMGDILSRTWTIFKDQMGMGILIFLVLAAIAFAAYVALIVVTVIGAVAGPVVGAVVQLACMIGFLLLGIWLGIGVVLVFLKMARGQPAEIGDLFKGGPYFVSVLLAQIVLGLVNLAIMAVCIGLPVGLAALASGEAGVVMTALVAGWAVAIVPLCVVFLMFVMFQFLIIDQNMGPIDALKLSMDVTSGNKLTMFLILLVTGIVGGLLAGVTCGLGYLVVVPYIMMLYSVMYLAMTGQATADQLQRSPMA